MYLLNARDTWNYISTQLCMRLWKERGSVTVEVRHFPLHPIEIQTCLCANFASVKVKNVYWWSKNKKK